jgi:cytoskeletal protein CcmA (bactofilin family)
LNKKGKQSDEVSALLGSETECEGKLSFEGAVRVDGKFSGEISSEGTLIIGEKAVVKAEVRAGIVLVYGETQGKLVAKERLEAYAPARILGDIQTPILVFGEGVIFQGSSQMGESKEKKGRKALEP